MSDKPDIDEGFDRVLSAFLRDELADPDPRCPSPAVLAAYYERRLDESETEHAEAHLAGCRACQELMAALVRLDAAPPSEAPGPERVERVEPVAPVEERRDARRGWGWSWIAAPVAVAATAVVALTLAHRSIGELGGARPGSADSERRSRTAETSAEAARSDRIAGAVAAPLASRKAESAAEAGAPPQPANAESASLEGRPAATTLAAREPSGVVVGARSDPNVAWRLRGGSIERSDDGAASWRVQAKDVASGLLAASAPSAEVCWFAGAHGVVLRTTDGEHWSRVESPTDGDLVEIVARSADTAFVKEANGRRFVTRDGGRTWFSL